MLCASQTCSVPTVSFGVTIMDRPSCTDSSAIVTRKWIAFASPRREIPGIAGKVTRLSFPAQWGTALDGARGPSRIFPFRLCVVLGTVARGRFGWFFGARGFTEGFHVDALVEHFQDCEGFDPAGGVEEYGVARG